MNTMLNSSRACQIALLASVLAALPVTAATFTTLRDGVLISESAVYLMRPGGGIDALALDSGKVVWETDEADRPVALKSQTLIAQRESRSPGQLTLVTLDARRGGQAMSTALPLPDDVVASVDDRMSSRFVVGNDATTDSEQLVWRYDTRLVQGAHTGEPAATPRRRAGVLEVRSQGDTVSIDTASRAAPDRPAARRIATADFVPKDARAFYSEDRQHILVSKRASGDERYRWQIHTREGDRLGAFPSAVSFTPFVVRNGVVLFLSAPSQRRVGAEFLSLPLMLRAVDVASGQERWSRDVRDTRYDGPYPP